MENLKITKREKNSNHSAKKTRRKGNVPGVIYGKRFKNFLFEIGEIELNKSISHTGEHSIFNVELDGENKDVLIKELQRDPVSNRIIHIDLEEIEQNKNIISNVPIKFIGEDRVKKVGAVVQKEKETVKVNCPLDKLPKYLELNLKKGSIGSVYRLEDLEIGDEISIVEDLEGVIASISYQNKITEAID
ncbi:50S ribosomal protein L25 [Clostridium fallax]|uniref:Large ribosomal subunit protein bL25 n=1 Tax=Clostridium fallax TaxID=1533 RepID=A0A1M4WPS8_9CLOT|nr:50S ribosomal protein L25 [Clostridium fallax]SHE83311.1 LSU ribosomal protein L25P [Clostridium fallax]SQB06267.1 50S ribosomal protein L25 [Clostridium fallax]